MNYLIRLLAGLPHTRPFPWATAGYTQYAEEADYRTQRGEWQRYCTEGHGWKWDDQSCCDAPRQTVREFTAENRAIERELRRQGLIRYRLETEVKEK